MSTNLKSMTKDQLIEMLGTKEEVLRQHKEMHAAQLEERDLKLAALQGQLDALASKTGRPVRREDPPSVKELPVLERDPMTGRAICPLDAEHGAVTPNTRGLCPKCYTKAVWAASPAGQAALKAEAEKAAA